jgi:hypothetical protein
VRSLRLDVGVPVAGRPRELVLDDDARCGTGEPMLVDERGDALLELPGDVGDRRGLAVDHQIPLR